MTPEEFKSALDAVGVSYRDSGVSLALQQCPECGSNSYSVRMRIRGVDGDDMFYGRCQKGRCQKGYSSKSYLIRSGMSYSEALRWHGHDPEYSIASLSPEQKLMSGIALNLTQDKEEPDRVIDVSDFRSIEAWPDHPVAAYAKKRGYVPEMANSVMMDIKTGAVVFLVHNELNQVIGYQKRFLWPKDPDMKTQSSSGFKKSKHIMVFERKGADIVICEGPFTAISAWHYGFTGICTFGCHVSDIQLEKILSIAESSGGKVKIGTSFDDDKAGNKGFHQVGSYMYWSDIDIFKVTPNSGNDLNDAWQAGSGITINRHANINPAIPNLDLLL